MESRSKKLPALAESFLSRLSSRVTFSGGFSSASRIFDRRIAEANPSFAVHFNFIKRAYMYTPARTRPFVIFSMARNTWVSTLFIHPRNSQPEGAHRPETHTRMWPLLFAPLVPQHSTLNPASWSTNHPRGRTFFRKALEIRGSYLHSRETSISESSRV